MVTRGREGRAIEVRCCDSMDSVSSEGRAALSWVGRHPLPVVLGLQACATFAALGLLPMWGDELFTARTVARPVGEIVSIVRRDIHPPLYFVLLHYWQKLPPGGTGIAALRAFSALWAVLATVLLDRFWTRFLKPAERWLALLMFAGSPCLLLYGRMARSYSMQTALSLLALAMLQRWLRKPRSMAVAAGALASMLALLYTHYLPGLALLAGFAAAGWGAMGAARMAAFLAATGAGYAFWGGTLMHALGEWWRARSAASGYAITGSGWLEHGVKLGFGVVSMTIGESFLAVSLALVPVVVALAAMGAKAGEWPRRTGALLAVAAVAGYLGAARWVSYAFVPARLLWMLPYLCMLVAAGIARLDRAWLRGGAAALILLSYASSDALYFRRENFLNLGYTAPLPEIVAKLERQARPEDLILVDTHNTDAAVILATLPGWVRRIGIEPGNVSEVRDRMRSAQAVWMVRNMWDSSPGRITTQVQAEACAGRTQRVTLLEPYAAWQEFALRLAGFRPVPTHFYEVVECGPQEGTLR